MSWRLHTLGSLKFCINVSDGLITSLSARLILYSLHYHTRHASETDEFQMSFVGTIIPRLQLKDILTTTPITKTLGSPPFRPMSTRRRSEGFCYQGAYAFLKNTKHDPCSVASKHTISMVYRKTAITPGIS